MSETARELSQDFYITAGIADPFDLGEEWADAAKSSAGRPE